MRARVLELLSPAVSVFVLSCSDSSTKPAGSRDAAADTSVRFADAQDAQVDAGRGPKDGASMRPEAEGPGDARSPRDGGHLLDGSGLPVAEFLGRGVTRGPCTLWTGSPPHAVYSGAPLPLEDGIWIPVSSWSGPLPGVFLRIHEDSESWETSDLSLQHFVPGHGDPVLLDGRRAWWLDSSPQGIAWFRDLSAADAGSRDLQWRQTLPDPTISTYCTPGNGDGTFFAVGTDGMLRKTDGSTSTVTADLGSPPGTWLSSSMDPGRFCLTNGSLFVYETATGPKIYDGSSTKALNPPSRPDGTVGGSFAMTSNGDLFFADGRVFQRAPSGWLQLNVDGLCPAGQVASLTEGVAVGAAAYFRRACGSSQGIARLLGGNWEVVAEFSAPEFWRPTADGRVYVARDLQATGATPPGDSGDVGFFENKTFHSLVHHVGPPSAVISGRSATELFAAGEKGASRLRDGAWETVPQLADMQVQAMWQAPDGTLFFADLDSAQQHWELRRLLTDGTLTLDGSWATAPRGWGAHMQGRNANDVTVGFDQTLLRWNGAQWMQSPICSDGYLLNSLHYSVASLGLVGANDGMVECLDNTHQSNYFYLWGTSGGPLARDVFQHIGQFGPLAAPTAWQRDVNGVALLTLPSGFSVDFAMGPSADVVIAAHPGMHPHLGRSVKGQPWETIDTDWMNSAALTWTDGRFAIGQGTGVLGTFPYSCDFGAIPTTP